MSTTATSPVYPTIASQFNDPGLTWMFVNLCRRLNWDPGIDPAQREPLGNTLVPGARVRYLAEIADQGRSINAEVERLAALAATAEHYDAAAAALHDDDAAVAGMLRVRRDEALNALGPESRALLERWDERLISITGGPYSYTVRGRQITGANYRTSLSGQPIPKIAPPRLDGAAGTRAPLPDDRA